MPTERPDLRKYDEPMERKHISLPPSMIQFCVELEGSLAEGVRACIEEKMERQDNDT